MVANADKIGTQVTVSNDNRITRIGAVIRKYRIDEIPQLFNILLGDMSLVGTRPESVTLCETLYFRNDGHVTYAGWCYI